MRYGGRWVVAVLIAVGTGVSGCSSATRDTPDDVAPAVVGNADANGVKSVKLTRQAFDRLGIETTGVRESTAATPAASSAAPSGGSTVVPYTAVVYDTTGVAWVYTMPEPLRFLRRKVVVERVGATDATLSEGPAVGTLVVSKGVPELYGAELGVGR